MAVSLITTIQRWKGLSTDAKPNENIRSGSLFSETDTGKQFIYYRNHWVEDLSEPVSASKAVDIGNTQRLLLEQILIESIEIRQLMSELVAIKKGE